MEPTGNSTVQLITPVSSNDNKFLVQSLFFNDTSCNAGSLFFTLNQTIHINQCIPPNEEYLQYGILRYPNAFSSQVNSITFSSTPPAPTITGLTTNFFRTIINCASQTPVSNQQTILTEECIPDPTQTGVATSSTTQYYLKLQV